MGEMGGGGGGGGSARKMERERQARMSSGIAAVNRNFDQFDENFYGERQKAYVDYATPYLAEQYKQQGKASAADLVRRGLRLSTAAVNREASLGREMGRKQAEVADAGLAAANDLRSDVESTRSNLINQAISGADPSSVSSSALSQAAAMRKPSSFGTIGTFFDDWSRIYMGNQVARSYDSSVPNMLPTFGKKSSSNAGYTVD